MSKPRRFTSQEAREICARYERGETARQLAVICGCSMSTVLSAVRQSGGSVRRPGEHDHHRWMIRKEPVCPTPTELRILDLLAHGMSPAEAANHLHIAMPTIKSHLKNARLRTGARNTLHAVVLCYHHGWLNLGERIPLRREPSP